MNVCKICKKEITDQGEMPAYVQVTGWTLDEDNDPSMQYPIDVCRDCFINRADDIMNELETKPNEYA